MDVNNCSDNEASYNYTNQKNLNADEDSSNDANSDSDESRDENESEGNEEEETEDEEINRVFSNSKTAFKVPKQANSNKFLVNNRKKCLKNPAIKNFKKAKKSQENDTADLMDDLSSSSTESSLRMSSSQTSMSPVVSEVEEDELEKLKRDCMRKILKGCKKTKTKTNSNKIMDMINLSPDNQVNIKYILKDFNSFIQKFKNQPNGLTFIQFVKNFITYK